MLSLLLIYGVSIPQGYLSVYIESAMCAIFDLSDFYNLKLLFNLYIEIVSCTNF